MFPFNLLEHNPHANRSGSNIVPSNNWVALFERNLHDNIWSKVTYILSYNLDTAHLTSKMVLERTPFSLTSGYARAQPRVYLVVLHVSIQKFKTNNNSMSTLRSYIIYSMVQEFHQVDKSRIYKSQNSTK